MLGVGAMLALSRELNVAASGAQARTAVRGPERWWGEREARSRTTRLKSPHPLPAILAIIDNFIIRSPYKAESGAIIRYLVPVPGTVCKFYRSPVLVRGPRTSTGTIGIGTGVCWLQYANLSTQDTRT